MGCARLLLEDDDTSRPSSSDEDGLRDDEVRAPPSPRRSKKLLLSPRSVMLADRRARACHRDASICALFDAEPCDAEERPASAS